MLSAPIITPVDNWCKRNSDCLLFANTANEFLDHIKLKINQ